MSAKTEWTYQKMFDKAKAIIKEDVYMKFYDETKPLYIETDVSGVGLGAAVMKSCLIMMMMPDVPFSISLLQVHDNECH